VVATSTAELFGEQDRQEERMPVTSNHFSGQQAPCGRIVDGDTYEDQDQEAILTQERDYRCGCRSIQHEYHDGSVSRKVIRHDGRVLVDELLFKE
jgi:hypothetical protein